MKILFNLLYHVTLYFIIGYPIMMTIIVFIEKNLRKERKVEKYSCNTKEIKTSC